MRLRGKTALVTGASSGIGRASALAFAREGARVALLDVSVAEGEALARDINESGDAVFIRCDVTRSEDVQSAVEETIARFGRLDCAFNNAGIEGAAALTAERTEEDWERVLAVNLKGVWLCMKYELSHMVRQRSGSIVNTASVAGLIGLRGASAYAASKHGVNGLTRTAALEYAPAGVRINSVCPGAIRTPMLERTFQEHPDVERRFLLGTPLGRLAGADEVAEAVVWLCSDAASFVTGLAMAVDGGMSAQ